MTNAPKEIWAVFEPHHSGNGPPHVYASASKTKGLRYVSEFELSALRDAALEEAARKVESIGSASEDEALVLNEAADAIRAMKGDKE